MDEINEEDLARLLKNQSRQIDILKYEIDILRAREQLLREIIVEALQGKRIREEEQFHADDT